MAGEIQKLTAEYDAMKWNLQYRIQEVEGDNRLQGQVKLLSRDAEVQGKVQLQTAKVAKASKDFLEEIQSHMQKDHKSKHVIVTKDHRIKELKSEVKQLETKLRKTEDDNRNKYKSVVQALKRCCVQLEIQYQAYSDQLQKAEKGIAGLQKNMKVLAARLHCIQKDQLEALEQKDATIQRLVADVEATRTGWDKSISQIPTEMVVKDKEIITLKDRESKLQTELERSREETERYKKLLSAGLKKEKALQQMKVQMELEWQRHFEDMKAKLYFANEKQTQELSQARDQVIAELREKEIEVQNLTGLLYTAKVERDQAVKEQNSILRVVVAQMRKDMEHLSHPLLHTQPQTEASSFLPVQHPGTAPPSNGDRFLQNGTKTYLMTKQKDILAAARSAVKEKEKIALSENLWHGQDNLPVLRKRLKQAASCIAHLIREKQQLIEMGNSLRAKINNANLKEPVEPEKGFSVEGQGEQHDQLSVLEQLQYQLTTQELQYALRTTFGTSEDQPLPESKKQACTTRGTATENKEPFSQSSSLDIELQRNTGVSRSQLSSGESLRSLKELWEILDHVTSPSVFSDGDHEFSGRKVTDTGGGSEDHMMVQGISVPINNPSPTKVQQRMNTSKTSSATTKTHRSGASSKIRNYNVKD